MQRAPACTVFWLSLSGTRSNTSPPGMGNTRETSAALFSCSSWALSSGNTHRRAWRSCTVTPPPIQLACVPSSNASVAGSLRVMSVPGGAVPRSRAPSPRSSSVSGVGGDAARCRTIVVIATLLPGSLPTPSAAQGSACAVVAATHATIPAIHPIAPSRLHRITRGGIRESAPSDLRDGGVAHLDPGPPQPRRHLPRRRRARDCFPALRGRERGPRDSDLFRGSVQTDPSLDATPPERHAEPRRCRVHHLHSRRRGATVGVDQLLAHVGRGAGGRSARRSRLVHGDARGLHPHEAGPRPTSQPVDALTLTAALLAAGLLVYLVAAILLPERFE